MNATQLRRLERLESLNRIRTPRHEWPVQHLLSAVFGRALSYADAWAIWTHKPVTDHLRAFIPDARQARTSFRAWLAGRGVDSDGLILQALETAGERHSRNRLFGNPD